MMRKESGFTLIEMMVTVTIIAILVAIAVPMWGKWIPSYRLKRATRDVYSSFQKAKMEAVRRNANVVISFGTTTNSYTMFVDDGAGTPANAGNFSQDGGEVLLGNFTLNHSNSPSVTVSFNPTTPTTFSGDTVGFTSRGLPAKPLVGPGFGNGRVNLINTKGIQREIILSMAGNIRIRRP